MTQSVKKDLDKKILFMLMNQWLIKELTYPHTYIVIMLL